MSEQFPKQPQKPKAMEGRRFDTAGTDLGDAAFHEIGYGTTPEVAKTDLERLAESEIEIAEQQAEQFVARDPLIGIKAYEGLIAIYKTSPNVERWKSRLEDLRKK